MAPIQTKKKFKKQYQKNLRNKRKFSSWMTVINFYYQPNLTLVWLVTEIVFVVFMFYENQLLNEYTPLCFILYFLIIINCFFFCGMGKTWHVSFLRKSLKHFFCNKNTRKYIRTNNKRRILDEFSLAPNRNFDFSFLINRLIMFYLFLLNEQTYLSFTECLLNDHENNNNF